MRSLAFPALVGGASMACAFAALGVALYPQPHLVAAAGTVFALCGAVAGLCCVALDRAWQGLPSVGGVCGATPAALPAQAAPAAAAPLPEPDTPAVLARAALTTAARPPAAASAVPSDAGAGVAVVPATELSLPLANPATRAEGAAAEPRPFAPSAFGA